MDIRLVEVSIRDLFNGYQDNAVDGVVAYGGKLDVRPAYQREFVYKDKQRDAVIETVRKNFPLNVMYWVDNENDTYEVLDGQQRTISICQYVNSDFSIKDENNNPVYFHNLTQEEKDQILDYKLMVYFCTGTDKEKLEWFKIINIAGEKLYDQEIRNAVYSGSWVTDAKRYFSKNQCPAYQIADKYLSGTPIRQDYLETAIEWIADSQNIELTDYMAAHQNDNACTELWLYFQNVISWVRTIFPNYYKEMKGIEWGLLYNTYKQNTYDIIELDNKIKTLMEDEDVTSKKGIFEYVLGGPEKVLSIRAFTPKMKREAYSRQNGICVHCHNHFEFEQMEGDHITPWHEGGKTISENCQMLCIACNRVKGGR